MVNYAFLNIDGGCMPLFLIYSLPCYIEQTWKIWTVVIGLDCFLLDGEVVFPVPIIDHLSLLKLRPRYGLEEV
jgi:hypothetical protein